MTRRIVIISVMALVFVCFAFGMSIALAQVMLKPRVLQPVVPKAEYTIKGGDFYHEAQNYGFNTNAHSLTFGSNCRESYRRDTYNVTDLSADSRNKPLGSKCNFTVFESGTLKNGFVFKRFTGSRNKSVKADIELKSSPAAGSTSIKFTFYGWCDPGNYAIYHIQTITLEGPAGRDWRDALR